MSKQTFTTGQILTAAQMTTLQANDYNQTVSAKTASYTLVASDAGTRITMSNASATAITVNTALFTAGDILTITNIGTGALTIQAGTATVSSSGSTILAQYDSGTLYFSSTSAAIWNGANPGDITGVTAGVGLTGGGTSGAVILNLATTAKGDLVAGTGASTAAALAVGNNGETLVADSAASTGLAYIPTFFAGKNKIINGDFGIWQRGTSLTPVSATWTYTSDRWQVYQGFSAGTLTVSRQTFTPGTAPAAPYESPYFLRVQTGSTNTSNFNFRQLIEDVRTFANQTVTFSFWAKASSAVSDVQIFLRQNFGSGGSTSVDTLSTPFAITTSWVRYSKTFTNPSISGKTIGTGSALEAYISTVSGTASSLAIDLWGVQVEAGSSVTSFQTATGTIQGETSACQRYYYRSGSQEILSFHAMGIASSTTDVWFLMKLPITMRVRPTSLDYANLIVTLPGQADYAFTNLALQTTRSDADVVAVLSTGSTGLTASRPYVLYNNSTANGYIGLNAEL